MKIYNFIFSVLAVIALSGCEKESTIDSGEKEPTHPSVPDESVKDEENKPEEEKVFLSFETLLSDMTPASSGVVNQFESGDSLSVFSNDTA